MVGRASPETYQLSATPVHLGELRAKKNGTRSNMRIFRGFSEQLPVFARLFPRNQVHWERICAAAKKNPQNYTHKLLILLTLSCAPAATAPL
jgi:hypothetical protein